MASRHDKGGSRGCPIDLVANYFLLKFKDINIFHYDINIVFVRQYRKDQEKGTSEKAAKKSTKILEQERIAKNDEKNVSHVEHQQNKIAPVKQICRTIITEICKDPNLQQYDPVYDGQKNLYTTKLLPITAKDGKKFPIKLDAEEKIKEFEVTVKPVRKKDGGNIISLEPLRELYQNRSKEVPQEVIMAFNTIMRHRNPPFTQIQVGQSFFLLNDKRIQLGEGLEIWYGYNQSVHLTQRGPAVLVNLTAKVFHQDGNVIDYASDILNTDIKRLAKLNPFQINQLEDSLKNVKVEVFHQKFSRKYRIECLTRTSAKDTRFKIDDKTEMSVADYFRKEYKALKFPHLPCIHMRTSKNTTFMPMEVCRIYLGQPKLGRLSGQMASQMIRETAIPPVERFKEIQKNAQLIKHVSGQQMSGFNLLMELKFMEFQGRVIGAPTLAYKPFNERAQIVKPDNRGTWKMDEKKFFISKESCSWVLLSFANERFCRMDKLENFVEMLCKCARTLGMNLERPKGIRIFRSHEETYSALNYAKDLLKSATVAFAVVVLSSRDMHHSYKEVKFIAEIQLKLLTQCMDEGVVVKKCNPEIAKNVLLKINTKLGGVNHILNQKPVIFSRPVIVFGSDTAHIPNGYSIAAVVGSLDAIPARYAVTCRVQQNSDKKKVSQEIIVELKDMVKEILHAFLENTRGKKPEKVIFFRAGVSKGQFDKVLKKEIEAIQTACRDVLDHIPPVTFIVVQKSHQTRLRPRNDKDGIGRPKNVPPGTVADTAIVHPVFFDFFLFSHEGTQGTSKPTHYTVLFDENKFSSDELQKLCYHLCHMYVRCNRSISMPAPVMYADLACTRANEYVDWYFTKHYDQSVSSYSSGNIKWPDEIIQAITNIKSFQHGMFYV